MKKIVILCLLAFVAGCSGITKETLGIAKKSPNERVVETRKPLSLPPEFDLRPVVDVES